FALLVAPLADPAQEARARALEAELRCVVCENEPISQSGAEAAQDMRALLRERIAAGDSDAQVRRYFADRYGDYVLLRPPLKPATAPLYLAPLLLAALAALAFTRLVRRGPGAEPAAEPEER
ncbi:MAG: cytochrome c-type biogenesis protein CcmH, partial [Hyphomonadaceae bacterium]|nr:cytochrome c-type biogenesis protein CcmH [Hyphomonadaceae bacterium]